MSKKIETENSLAEIISNDLNKKFKHSGIDISCILGDDFQSASDVKFWIPTGSSELDLAISNRMNGGYPSGKIIEITGLEASGKSLLAAYAIANVQKMGGVGVLIDTEHAISRDFLETIGVDSNKMVYAQIETMEDIFQSIEYMLESHSLADVNNKPIVIIVDSVAGASTKMEQSVEYDKDGYATGKAIIISKAMRKITQLVGRLNAVLIFTNQLRLNINAKGWGDPYCVDPYSTKITIRYKNNSDEYVEEKMYIEEFSDRFCNNDDFSTYEEFDLIDYNLEILTRNRYGSVLDTWNPIKAFIVKQPVHKFYTDGKLQCSSNHKILHTDEEFIKVKNHPEFKEVNESLHIVDFELGGTHTYLANDRINHNTTSGGMALGFHSSVRIRTKKVGMIKAMVNNIEQVVGIKTKAQVTKNRVGPPFKSANFNIYFDSGIDEVGSILETCKNYGIIKQGGAWSSYVNIETGEEIKFYGKDFHEKVLLNEENKYDIYKRIAELSIVKYKPSFDETVTADLDSEPEPKK